MKYALIDGELHRHDNEANAYLPLSLAEAQHVVDVMNTYDSKVFRSVLNGIAVMAADLPEGFLEAAEARLDTEGTPV